MGDGKMLLRMHFANGKVLIVCLGTAFLPGICTANNAALINAATGTTLATCAVVVNGSTVSTTMTGNYQSEVAWWATSSYEAPPALGDPMYPPSPGSNVLFTESACSWKFAVAPNMAWVANWAVPGDGREVLIPPKDGYPEPGVPAAAGTPQPGDINGDGQDDWDFWVDFLVPGTGDVMIDGWVIDKYPYGADSGDYIVIVIGHDSRITTANCKRLKLPQSSDNVRTSQVTTMPLTSG